MSEKIQTRFTDEGAVLRIVLDAPKGNVIDSAMIRDLDETLTNDARRPGLKALVFEGSGAHFSFGASVEEHAPDKVGDMLPAFHGLFVKLAQIALPTFALVRGRCLGGGLELASYASWIFASPDAVLGQPEIRLGVFAPVGSVLLSHKLGPRVSEQMLLTGRSLAATEALELGLVDAISDDPEKAALDYIGEHILPLSATALHYATRAARRTLHEALVRDLKEVEALYLDDLMQSHDAAEGIQAFLEKRKPVWKNV